MTKKVLFILATSFFMLGLTSCVSKQSPVYPNGTLPVDDSLLDTLENPVIETVNQNEDVKKEFIDFSAVTGTYSFSSGAGGWGTEVTIDPDGRFVGNFRDSEMGVTGDDYPNGTLYNCDFHGNFENIQQIGEYTFSARLANIETAKEVGLEEIIDGIKYVYSEPYGFENASIFEFYLPGKQMAQLTEGCLNWISFYTKPIYPTVLTHKVLYNVNDEKAFNNYNVMAYMNSNIPQSLEIDLQELAGMYVNDLNIEMCISIFSDISDFNTAEYIGTITWKEHEMYYIYNPDAQICQTENGFKGVTEYRGEYHIIITDNTTGAVKFDIYSEDGIYYGTYKMTEHFES